MRPHCRRTSGRFRVDDGSRLERQGSDPEAGSRRERCDFKRREEQDQRKVAGWIAKMVLMLQRDIRVLSDLKDGCRSGAKPRANVCVSLAERSAVSTCVLLFCK